LALQKSALISLLSRLIKPSQHSMRSLLNRIAFRASPLQSYFRIKSLTQKDSAFATSIAKRR
jgi:hypothetical protein